MNDLISFQQQLLEFQMRLFDDRHVNKLQELKAEPVHLNAYGSRKRK